MNPCSSISQHEDIRCWIDDSSICWTAFILVGTNEIQSLRKNHKWFIDYFPNEVRSEVTMISLKAVDIGLLRKSGLYQSLLLSRIKWIQTLSKNHLFQFQSLDDHRLWIATEDWPLFGEANTWIESPCLINGVRRPNVLLTSISAMKEVQCLSHRDWSEPSSALVRSNTVVFLGVATV